MTIIRQSEFWTRENVQKDKKQYYIFGDNEAQSGDGGQACIRGLTNAFGIPTKKSATEYWNDDDYQANVAAIEAAISKIPTDRPWVISQDGLGTGLADLPRKAPNTYRYLVGRITGLECEGYVLPPGKVLVLRTCTMQRTGNHCAKAERFVYPERGYVQCDDWNSEPVCGSGLHGALWGVGVVTIPEGLFQVLEVEETEIVDLDDKCKFPSAYVLYTGNSKGATDLIRSFAPNGAVVIYSHISGRDRSKISGGDGSHLSGGYRSHLSGGYRSHLSGGDESIARSLNASRCAAGNGGVLQVCVWDGYRWRGYTADVGETYDGLLIEPDVFYCIENGKWAKSDNQSPVEPPEKPEVLND